MREFVILIFELICIAAFQIIISAIFDEGGPKWVIKAINIACIIIGYFLLLRYVYNLFSEQITTFVNFYF